MPDTKEIGCAALDQILALLGYTDAVPLHKRYTLLSAVALFSGSNGRPEIAASGENKMAAIRKENANG